nr:homoprotocatechuate degradation operon regulator HpaR [uncultured Moellerella sp.]
MQDSLIIALLQARETAMGFFRPILKTYSLTEQQWRIICILVDNRSIDFQQLAMKSSILPPSLTGILSRMERDGLVFRLKPLNDQRKLYISLTVEGQALYDQANEKIEERYRAIEDAFTQDKLQQFIDLLGEFILLNEINDPNQKSSN